MDIDRAARRAGVTLIGESPDIKRLRVGAFYWRPEGGYGVDRVAVYTLTHSGRHHTISLDKQPDGSVEWWTRDEDGEAQGAGTAAEALAALTLWLARQAGTASDERADLVRAQDLLAEAEGRVYEARIARDRLVRSVVAGGTSMYAVAQATGLSETGVAKIVRR